MGLPWKPHIFTVWQLVPDVVDGVLVRSHWTPGPTVAGLMVAKTPREVGDLIDRESKNPAVVLLDVADAASISLGDRVEHGGNLFQVAADPQIHAMGLPTDHARLIVEGLD